MSARDKLMSLMGANRNLAEKVADEILNDHAHELAEAIRSEATRAATVAWAEPMFIAADLVDPEVMP